MEQLQQTLEKFVSLHASPGFEGKVRDFVISEMSQFPSVSWAVDGIGNLLVRVEGRDPSAKKLLFDAHMDEPCFMVKYIDERGFLHFVQLGFVVETVATGQPVLVHGRKGDINGAFGVRSFHLTTPQQLKEGLTFEDMWIDIGANSKKNAYELGVRPGSPVTFDSFMRPLVNNCVMGRAMDNRTGCTLALELVRKAAESPVRGDVFISFSVQEELYLRGSTPVIRGIERYFGTVPDIAIAFDICTAGDFPGIREGKAPIALNGGPGVKVYDRSASSHYSQVTPLKLIEEIERITKERSIPFQYDFLSGSTNADVFSLESSGILTTGISIPCRYTHSPVETISLQDMKYALDLCLAILEEADVVYERASTENKSANYRKDSNKGGHECRVKKPNG